MGRKIASTVEYNSGYSNCDHPIAIWWQGQRHPVKAIISEWRTPVEKHYRLLVAEDLILKAILNEKENFWKVERI
jgi:hypothetical protein